MQIFTIKIVTYQSSKAKSSNYWLRFTRSRACAEPKRFWCRRDCWSACKFSILEKAENAGLKVAEVPEAVKQADLVMILTPDEFQSQLYRDVIEPNIKEGATLAFAHGFSVLYNQVVPRKDLDVIMVAPKHQAIQFVLNFSAVQVYLI